MTLRDLGREIREFGQYLLDVDFGPALLLILVTFGGYLALIFVWTHTVLWWHRRKRNRQQ